MYNLIVFSVIFASLNSVFLHKANFAKNSSVYKFNMLGTIVWCICLFAINGFKININKNVLLWGIIYGITQTLFMLFKTLAMNCGPVSTTTLIVNISLVLSILFCYFVWQEPIHVTDILGVIILLLGIILSTYEKKESINGKWLFYSIFLLLFAASVGVCFKAFGKTGSLNYAGDMMLISAIVMLVLYFVLFLWTKKQDSPEEKNNLQKEFLLYAIISGCLSCAYNRLNIFLSSSLDAVIFFPAFNGGVILLSAFLSTVLCKEKLKPKKIIAIILGLIGICIIGIF